MTTILSGHGVAAEIHAKSARTAITANVVHKRLATTVAEIARTVVVQKAGVVDDQNDPGARERHAQVQVRTKSEPDPVDSPL